MQKGKLIKLGLSLLMGVGLFLISKGEVFAAYSCDWFGYDCGVSFPSCWNKYCDCPYGCYINTCSGGVCKPKPTCSDCGTYPYCFSKYCSSSCTYGCKSTSCSGGVCNPVPKCPTECGTYPNCYDKYCDPRCPYGCSSTSCSGGTCKTAPAPTPTPTPTPACISDGNCLGTSGLSCCSGVSTYDAGCSGSPVRCVAAPDPTPTPTPSCQDVCKSSQVENWCDGAFVNIKYTCPFGCNLAGNDCTDAQYCINQDCGTPFCVEGEAWVECWTNEGMDPADHIDNYPQCISTTSCSVGECHPVTGTCGGTITKAQCDALYPGMGYVSHIDNCGGQDCGPPCSSPGTCTPEYPTKPTLLLPVDGGVAGEEVTLSWSRDGYGVGCPQSNSQDLYLEAEDSSPDVKIADLNSGVSTYDVSGLSSGTVYYWRVILNNGDLSMSSDVYSFTVDGLIEGYLFDSGGLSSCPADLSDPAYDSRKIGGGLLDITGTSDYLDVTSIADGSYSQGAGIPGSYVLGNFRLGSGFVSTPDLVCDGTSVEFLVGGSGTAIRSFGFLRDYDGWWQGVGGDVYGGLGIGSTIPGSCTVGVCDPYLVADDANGESGLVRYRSGNVDLGDNESAAVNSAGWVVNSGYAGQDTNYAYYNSKMALIEKTSWAGSGKPVFNPEVGSDYEIYAYTGTGTIDFDVASGEKMIFMVNGDVDVTADVDVANGGHLAVIASGSISFASDVSQVDGWWVGDSLNIESTGDTATELQFRGEGSFIGWNGVSLNRDRGGSNSTEPAEEFVFRPDLMINAPLALKFSRYVWQEKAPN